MGARRGGGDLVYSATQTSFVLLKPVMVTSVREMTSNMPFFRVKIAAVVRGVHVGSLMVLGTSGDSHNRARHPSSTYVCKKKIEIRKH